MSKLPRSLMSLADLSPDQIRKTLGLARRLKHLSGSILPPTGAVMREANWRLTEQAPNATKTPPQSLRNMSVALLFSKRSTRTRVAAETASKLLGGQAIFLGQEDIQLGVNESTRDTARVLSGMCQGIFARVGEHSEIEELAKYAEVPVINALSSLWHPTQVLADIMTLQDVRSLQEEPTNAPNPYTIPYSSQPDAAPDPQTSVPNSTEQATSEGTEGTGELTSSEAPSTESAESPVPGDASSAGSIQTPTSNFQAAQHRVTQKRRYLRPLTIAYVGDSANVLHDMLVTYPRLGHKLQIASPPNPRYRAPTPVWDKVVHLGCDKSITWTEDPREAVQDADVVITDTWISMGQEAEYEQRVKDFQGYQVTEKLCEGAKAEWKFLHCLPRKSHEVDDEVFYGPRSLVFHEADNRKWTIMALFHTFFGGASFSALPHGRTRPLYTPGQKGKNGPGRKKSQNKSAEGATEKKDDETRSAPQLSNDEKKIFDETLARLHEKARGGEAKSEGSANPASSATTTENKV